MTSDAQIAVAAQEFRKAARAGATAAPSVGAAPGALQANLAIVPSTAADAFAAYCAANPKPCPLLARGTPGDRGLPSLGRDLDVATDAPAYRLFRDGVRAEKVDSLAPYWRDDLVAFALGCSFSFEAAMEAAGLPVRHVRRGRNVPMYVTTRATKPAPPFKGPMVVSMRPIAPEIADAVTRVSAAFPFAHGAPIHIGDPAALGVADIHRPDFGDPPEIASGEVCAFWACGVTPQLALLSAGLDFAATHEPGCMLVTDLDAAAPELPAWRA